MKTTSLVLQILLPALFLGSTFGADKPSLARRSGSCAPAPAGLVSWWRGEGNALDQAGANHATLAGSVAFGPGRVNQGFVFARSGDAVQLGNPANLQLQNFSIETWIRRSSAKDISPDGNGMIFAYGAGGYGIYLDHDGHPALSRIGANNVTSSAAITDTNFHHLAVTKSAGTVIFYVDGGTFRVPNYEPGFIFNSNAAIGRRGDNAGDSFLGTIDELAIYDRALSADEIELIYRAGNAGKCRPSEAGISLTGVKLIGDLKGDQASFTLTATAVVDNPRGGTLDLLSGTVALTEVGPHPKWNVRAEPNRFVLVFEQEGKFAIQIKFDAALWQRGDWKGVDFRVAQSPLQPIVLRGLPDETQFEFAGAARPERKGDEFVSYLPSDGAVRLSWKEARPESEGKLFYSAEMLSQISVSPGLMRQTTLMDFKVMQGELSRVGLVLHGAGEVTRVQGDHVLAWNVEAIEGSQDRRLVVQFNQPQKDMFSLQVQMQTPLGAFPQTVDALRLRPENATRFAGYFRIVNEGAVRLEVAQATGLSQISPDQFPETDATKSALRLTGSQKFAYRFSGAEFALRIQADQVLPELSVSEVLAYQLSENELAIDGELELEIRDAPLRELLLHVPKGYVLAKLNASGLNDYFLREPDDQTDAELRLVYGQPVSGRQLVQLRLERNKALTDTTWTLPRVEVVRAKSVRGHVGIAADAGFRMTPERTQGLTEIATAFFPRKLGGIQGAFRLSDANWQATVRIERLPQTVQADAFHLFSIGEGIAYGSSIMNYSVSGAPMAAFKVELSGEYFNVEFTGKDIRGWQKTEGGYLVQLHTPVSGAYTLLATYERPFKAQGETLTFTGARPLDAQSEQGHTLIISAYQFRVEPADVSASLLPLETGEVPPEYRLFFDAPILAAYRYTSRPFNLKLALSPLAQGDSLSQVVDRASLITHISKEGQVVTDVRYFVKNRGNPHFRLTLPPGTQLWSANVNGAPVVPVIDGAANLIPLPQRADPNAVLTLDLKLAVTNTVVGSARLLNIGVPRVEAPVMLAEWKLEPDTNQRLVYKSGSLTPIGGVPDISGFAELARTFSGDDASRAGNLVFIIVLLLAAAAVLWRWAIVQSAEGVGVRRLIGAALGVVAFAMALMAFSSLKEVTVRQASQVPREVAFLAPVQTAGSPLTVEVANVPDTVTFADFAGHAWPAIFAVLLWAYGWRAVRSGYRVGGLVLGWTLLGWAALRVPNGSGAFLIIIMAFLVLHFMLPVLRRLSPWPRQAQSNPAAGAAPVVTALLLMTLIVSGTGCAGFAGSEHGGTSSAPGSGPAERVSQEIRIEEKFALASAHIRWSAEEGQVLPLLMEPAVMTRVSYPTNSLKLLPASGAKRGQQLMALKAGTFDIALDYQVQVGKKDAESGFTLPVPYGVINQLSLSLSNLDVYVFSPQAVSVRRELTGSNTVATLVLSPAPNAYIGWKPRSRDVKHEKAVFYAEVSQLYVPTAGVIEGSHYVSIRPAQGELNELIIDVPRGATITDVVDPAKPAEGKAPASIVSLWRFDPDTRKLRITLNPAQSRPFAVLVRSQAPAGTLPYEQTAGLLKVESAAGQIGLVGLATGNEVQMDSVGGEGLSPINLEDFPNDPVLPLQSQIPGLAVRRAFRYSDPSATVSLKAAPVEPDVRVETADTLSLGDDRTVLASTATVDITRAGIFRLSFVMPAGFDVESISGPALSHWTESKSDADRIITLHLNGKTEGRQQLSITLAGPGAKATNAWAVPQVILREANKQRGTLLVVPEQGMRLQVAGSEGVTQLDPQKSGVRQKGVLAFRILQAPWNLSLSIERVEPWIQVTSLQHALVNEAQVKILANLQYQIENTGLKSFRVFVPTNAEGVRFQGDQVADSLKVQGAITNGLQQWEIKLHRRVIGSYLLQVSYQVVMPEQAKEAVIRGVQAAEVNVQRGYVTVQSGGRLQLHVDNTPEALQPTEWQSIPRALQQDLQTAAANFAYRLVEPSFDLVLKVERHDAARLLAARVNSINFNSVISDDGIMLTQARIEIIPGDKRLLNITLPKDAKFWFAFVNQNGVWPWREQDRILIPLEQQSRGARPSIVEFYYSARIGEGSKRALDLELLAPRFDLPLENLTWRVSLNDKWEIKKPTGSLQLDHEEVLPQSTALDLQTYLQNENALQQERTREAEELMSAGNSALEKGDPQLARRAFQAAFGLSTHDAAFNEDARVQLHNIKLQQALVGLNVRQATTTGGAPALGGKLRDLHNRKEINYSQQEAKDIIDKNTADDNAAYMRLAERLVQQQDAAVNSPAAIRASIPEQGRMLTFKRAVVVGTFADLKIDLKAKAAQAASIGIRIVILAGTLVFLGVFGLLGAKIFRPRGV